MKTLFFTSLVYTIFLTSCQGGGDRTSKTDSSATTMPFSDSILLHATDDMLFDKTLFKVKAGTAIKLTLENTGIPSGNGAMGHNVVILSPGTDIPSFAEAGRSAKETDYISPSYASAVIAHTGFVAGGKSGQVKFTLARPGVYDFICSYPGHWGTMQGSIIAE